MMTYNGESAAPILHVGNGRVRVQRGQGDNLFFYWYYPDTGKPGASGQLLRLPVQCPR